jgi:hypothetical protein
MATDTAQTSSNRARRGRGNFARREWEARLIGKMNRDSKGSYAGKPLLFALFSHIFENFNDNRFFRRSFCS